MHTVRDLYGLVRRLGRKRRRAEGTPLSAGAAPNDLWCADFKGEFQLGNQHCCYPLTVTDHASRDLLLCEARSEEHTSELQSLMRISYAVFCLQKNNRHKIKTDQKTQHSTYAT